MENCVQQLTSCAAALRTLDDTNGESEQNMIVDVPEAEVGEKQRKFERAIVVLNELLKGYRARPRFPPGESVAADHGQIGKPLGTPINITIRWYNQGSVMPVSIIL